MLGQGRYEVFLYDRGGQILLGKFERITKLGWNRVLNDIAQASLTVSTPPDIPNCCSFYGDIRSMRHELVIFRNAERIWEGPVTRVAYFADRVEIQARDMLQWTARRVHRGRFSDDGANVIDEAYSTINLATLYDDPSLFQWVQQRRDGALTVRSAYNRGDGTYYDALVDYTDKGLNFTTVGRSIQLWPSSTQIGQTVVLRSTEDFIGDVSVVEDGLALVTRGVSTGGDDFGASTPEPEIINYSINPEPWGGNGWKGSVFFLLTAGNGLGTIHAAPPAKPASGATNKVTSQYNKTLSNYQETEVVLSTIDQAIIVHEGELISARLLCQPLSGSASKLGLRLRAMLDDGTVTDDRSFAEGTPVTMKASTYRELTVSGTVPEKVVKAFVEVYRDTSVEWKTSSNGFTFKQFGLWRGRLETWFDPDTAASSTFQYGWCSAPHGSTSYRRYLPITGNLGAGCRPSPPFSIREVPKLDPYYGIVEQAQAVDETTRAQMEAASRDLVARSNPSPLAVDVPQGMALSANAEVTIAELVAGTTVPVETTVTCRQLHAVTTLSEVAVSWDSTGEQVNITLVSGRVWGIDIEDSADVGATFVDDRVLGQADVEVSYVQGE